MHVIAAIAESTTPLVEFSTEKNKGLLLTCNELITLQVDVAALLVMGLTSAAHKRDLRLLRFDADAIAQLRAWSREAAGALREPPPQLAYFSDYVATLAACTRCRSEILTAKLRSLLAPDAIVRALLDSEVRAHNSSNTFRN